MTAINSTMFDTPNRGNQSSNINQLSPELGNIAYQVNDSLLAGGESVKVDALLSILNLTSSYSQSDKISSGYLANILAHQPAKVLADVSAKIYANQLILTTVGGWDSSENLKRGKFTPFAKGDFSHLSKEANYPHWQGLNWVTTRGGIEFCESIKGKIIEFCQSIKKGGIELLDTIKNERIEFFESIKKGSQSATLGNVDIEYRASENINISLLLWYGKYQLLDLTPNLSSSLRQAVLTHALNEVSAEAVLICSNRSSSKRICFIVLPERSNAFFSFFSCIGNYHGYNDYEYGNYRDTITQWLLTKKAMPRSALTLTGHLITNDSLIIEVTMSKHNTPVTGRTSLTPNQSYRWLFLALNRNDYTAKPCRIAVTASNEHDARLMLVRDYILSFAGRLPAQEVAHA
ncbi:host cell division inhibitor Icd-like protein [Providencia manganoxydans]|uniref:host cell division inhibitor Icd-like protein n=1 Tax=Providencia manganoxydans TaxID=2923283 RepID=UPI003D7E1FF0